MSGEKRLIYAGIDEAGYGPRLGPLCVGATVFEVRGWEPGAKHPDVWKLLRKAVCKKLTGAKRGKLPIADSKKLLLHTGEFKTSALHLERGVLAFCGACGGAEETWAGKPMPLESALFAHLMMGEPTALPWYAGDSALPHSTTEEHLRILTSGLSGACERAGVTPLKVRCRVLDESVYNRRLAETRNKAAVSFALVGAFIRGVWEKLAGEPDQVEGGPRIVIDRQGGRTFYAEVLARELPGAEVRIVEETERSSRYDVVATGDGDHRRMSLMFRVEAETHHFPVALASMTAKLVREMMMARFNRYWCGRIAELKPTAGYATDAGRWLRDIRGKLSREDVEALVRRF